MRGLLLVSFSSTGDNNAGSRALKREDNASSRDDVPSPIGLVLVSSEAMRSEARDLFFLSNFCFEIGSKL